MNVPNKLTCFKAYDVRGKLGKELNEDIAFRIGRAVAQFINAKTLVLGFDARETSAGLSEAISTGVCESGTDIINIGLCGTEEVYAAVTAFGACAGIQITASHNPIEYNGMKIIKQGSQPLSDFEFSQIRRLAEQNKFVFSERSGSIYDYKERARELYISKILDFVDVSSLRPLKIVVNSGNGVAGPVIDALIEEMAKRGVRTNFHYVNHNPDASFPNGIPNPMIEENRSSTADAVIREKADFGVAFDGDFDRCFLFDQHGNFISGEYVMGLLAEFFLSKEEGGTIVHDPRIIWNILDIVNKFNGNSVVAKTGHAFVKAKMRETGAIYGGEVSAHHYFRDFFYCDSGMIPWLVIWQLLSEKKLQISEVILERTILFPSSGELNFTVPNPKRCIKKIEKIYSLAAKSKDQLDGLTMNFEHWRFNLRISNTEPLVRLNVEAIYDKILLRKKTEELKDLILSQ